MHIYLLQILNIVAGLIYDQFVILNKKGIMDVIGMDISN